MHKPRPRDPQWLRLVKLIGGTALVVLGILGLLLPILPGWIFLIPGLAVLSTATPKVRRKLAPVRIFFHKLQALARRKKRPLEK